MTVHCAKPLRSHVRQAMLALGAVILGACGFLPISRISRHGTDVLKLAAKPAPIAIEFEGCGPEGSQPDYPLNRRKNRIDEAEYIPVDWNVLARLPWPRRVGYRFRNQWTSGEKREVARYEGAAISVEGFLIGHKLEIREPTNCYSDKARHKDYHVWLARLPGDGVKRGIVVELTPRVRVSHPRWTSERLDSLEASRTRVRVSGWLMLDQMHPERVLRNRVTLWEVHPVMRIEWHASDKRWISLDSVAQLPAEPLRTPGARLR